MQHPLNLIELDSVASTNTWLAQNAHSLPDHTLVSASDQNQGRGQRGNSWESAPGKNLTLSYLYRPAPTFRPADQFAISEATALAVSDMLTSFGIRAKVKWPNDIYVGDRKICGILIEHSLMGTTIQHSVIGAGININQTEFLSDAPNPVSMLQLQPRASFNLEAVRDCFASCLQKRLDQTQSNALRSALHSEFLANLWRGDGKPYLFREDSTGKTFPAAILDVDPRGPLYLSNRPEPYAFKEIAFVL